MNHKKKTKPWALLHKSLEKHKYLKEKYVRVKNKVTNKNEAAGKTNILIGATLIFTSC